MPESSKLCVRLRRGKRRARPTIALPKKKKKKAKRRDGTTMYRAKTVHTTVFRSVAVRTILTLVLYCIISVLASLCNLRIHVGIRFYKRILQIGNKLCEIMRLIGITHIRKYEHTCICRSFRYYYVVVEERHLRFAL